MYIIIYIVAWTKLKVLQSHPTASFKAAKHIAMKEQIRVNRCATLLPLGCCACDTLVKMYWCQLLYVLQRQTRFTLVIPVKSFVSSTVKSRLSRITTFYLIGQLSQLCVRLCLQARTRARVRVCVSMSNIVSIERRKRNLIRAIDHRAASINLKVKQHISDTNISHSYFDHSAVYPAMYT